MTKEEHIEYWIKTSEHDLDAMQGIFEAGKYDWALFVGHLALEKILKAHWVKNNENITPPKIHNLVKLYHESNLLSLNKEELVFLNEVTGFNLEGRYPETKLAFYRLCTKEFTEDKIKTIKELYQCLRKEM